MYTDDSWVEFTAPKSQQILHKTQRPVYKDEYFAQCRSSVLKKYDTTFKFAKMRRSSPEIPESFVIPFFLYLIKSFILALSSFSPANEWTTFSMYLVQSTTTDEKYFLCSPLERGPPMLTKVKPFAGQRQYLLPSATILRPWTNSCSRDK